MGFQLVIAEGKEAGREFVFDQLSVLIGRTSDCDVVLYDPGVSRKHARIFSEGTGYFVEDMGSSNGTKVNGAIVKKKQLADGDAITLGPVVFNYAGISLEPEGTDAGQAAPGEDGSPHTRIVSAADVQARRSRNKGVAMVPDNAQPEQLKELARTSTRTMQAVKRASNPNIKPTNGLARASAPNPAPVRRSAPQPSGSALSAADRARIRRQSGASSSLKIFWLEASKSTRILVSVGVALAVLGLAFGAWTMFKPPPVAALAEEPTALIANEAPIEQSFGYGDDVDYQRADQKIFDFDFKSPSRLAVVVLHFQAKDISDKEVVVAVNGQDVNFVPADNMAVNERSNEILVPPDRLNRNANNKIVFDNVRNPPSKETWRVWNIWVEFFPLPELAEDELVRDAMTDFGRGEKAMEASSISAENTYKAWRAFRDAWLKMESITGTKPDQYLMARDKMKVSQLALDRLCSKLLLEAEGAYNTHKFEEARAVLEHVHTYFPKKDQLCPAKADFKREVWGI